MSADPKTGDSQPDSDAFRATRQPDPSVCDAEENSSDRNPIDLLADDFAQRIRSGEHPSVDEYVARHPDLESEIRLALPAIARMEKASRHQLSRAGASGRLVADWDLDLDHIGDFQILRKLGQGGMGIVYEALQTSLQRRVALKIISPAISNSPRQLERFKREAATAARLHHTNIIPVFGSGEENGIHFFAMQLIDGIPLHQAVRNFRLSRSFVLESGETSKPGDLSGKLSSGRTIDQPASESTVLEGGDWLDPEREESLPTPTSDRQRTAYRQRVCICVADIADALQYAHEQGVLHRDIKPSNLLMDRSGTVWVSDFGLAKFDENDVLTRTGDMVGTLRYMAPEQFSGESEPRSDICSLGLTLFELLTLQPAYSETRSAPLIQQKTNQAPPSPRIHDPGIPKDLETIVLKASAIDPAVRYRNAGDFRDDLIRFVEGRPIAARRLGIAERIWRWSRRNPTVASLSGVSLLLLVAVAVVAVVGNQQTRAALQDKNKEFARAEAAKTRAEAALDDARKQRQLADSNFSTAIRAFEEIMDNISRRGIPQGIVVQVEDEEIRSFETSLSGSDVEVLETLLEFFAEFAEENRADLTYQSAQAQHRVGDILQSLGRLPEAEEAYAAAIDSFSELNPAQTSAMNLDLVRMRILNQLAYCANQRGDFEQAEARLDQVRETFDSSTDRRRDAKLELARSFNIFTSMYTRVGFILNQKRIYVANRNASSIRNSQGRRSSGVRKNKASNNKPTSSAKDKVPPGRPEKPQTSRNPRGSSAPRVWVNINHLFRAKKADIRKANGRALRILHSLQQEDPNDSEVLLELARAYQDRVRITRYAKDQRAVIQAFDNAVQILEGLVDKHPNNPAYRFELADLYCNLDRTRNSLSGSSRAVKVARDLSEQWPNVSEYRALYANALAKASIRRFTNQPGNIRRLQEAVDIYRELIDKNPAQYAYKINFSQYRAVQAAQTAKTGEWESAAEMFDEAIASLEKVGKENDSEVLIDRIRSEIEASRSAAQRLVPERQ